MMKRKALLEESLLVEYGRREEPLLIHWQANNIRNQGIGAGIPFTVRLLLNIEAGIVIPKQPITCPNI